MKYFTCLLLFLSTFASKAQTPINGIVMDQETSIPIAFVKITHQDKTYFSDWEGKFYIENTIAEKPLIFSFKGFYDKHISFVKNEKNIIVKLITNTFSAEKEVSQNSTNAIIKKVIAYKKKNSPEKALPNFSYKNYEHLLVTADISSISEKIDTIHTTNFWGKEKIKLDSTNFKFKKLIEKQHLYQTEKVTLYQHHKTHNKETILAARMAGFQTPLYEYLGLQLVPNSVYDNPLELVEIPIQNPISNYGRKLYIFHLIDTLKIENRAVYKIYFEPKNTKSNRLRGLLYVDCESFAITKALYRLYGIVNINASYNFSYLPEQNIWFPKKKKIIINKGNNSEDLKILGETIKFQSGFEDKNATNVSDNVFVTIESSTSAIEIGKKISLKQPFIKTDFSTKKSAVSDDFWQPFLNDSLDIRKKNTYISLDSLALAENIEHKVFLGKKIINGYFPIGYFDLDLRSILKYNNFEGFRLGVGGISNAKFSEKYAFGFYGAYGLKDRKFKYSVNANYNVNNFYNTVASVSYTDDISEIAQTNFTTDNKRFKVYDPRPFNITTFYNHKTFLASIKSSFIAKTITQFSLSQSHIMPLFDYRFFIKDKEFRSYDMATMQIAVQWSPFSEYMQLSDKQIETKKSHPKFSLQFTQTLPNFMANDFTFHKIDFKTLYIIPYISGQKSTVLLQAGFAFGDIPLTHAYSISPNNLNNEAILQRITFAGKNSFETMYFNEFFSDRFVALHLKHTFNKTKISRKLKPEFSVISRIAWGTMLNTNNHLGLGFQTLEKGYLESGIECNKLFKGFGIAAFYRFGNYQLPTLDKNIAIKISYNLDLGF